MTNFIICDNCNKLQDKITVLEKNNQLLSAEVVQRDAVIISLQSSHHSPSDGIVALKQKEQTQRIQLEQKDAIITKLYSDIAKLIQEKEELRQTNHNLARELFGSKSEANNKLNKSNKATNSSIKGNSSDNSNNNDNAENKRKKPDRSNSRKLCKNLPTIVINHILPKGQDICVCCAKRLRIIGYKTSYQYDVIPAQLQLIKHQRAQYGCSSCKSGNSMQLAHFTLGHNYNTLAAPNLLAYLAINKYDYHLPLSRQIRMIAAINGHKLYYNTVNSWIIATAFDLQPIVVRLIDILMAQKHIFSDDTTTKTIIPGFNKARTSRLWVYISKESPIVIYDFTLSRENKHPKRFLKNFIGYLQTDAYSGYYALYQDENGILAVIPVFCMAHCRRNFFKITELSNCFGLADTALEYIAQLYAIEDKIKDKSVEDKYQCRQQESIPIINDFHAWLINTKSLVLPGSSLEQAINYALNHWTELTNYCLDGKLEIDNNRSERKMRGPKLGMNNYRFYGSENGGLAAAIYLSLFETCKENNIIPYIWLADVIPKLRYYKSSQLDELLPLATHWAKYNNAQLKQNAA